MRKDVIFILDRSGSMTPIRHDTIGGVNTFLEQLKNDRGDDDDVRASLYQFDDQYEVVFENQPLDTFEPLTTETYLPRGNTALYGAIGKTLRDRRLYYKGLPPEERPEKVSVVIMTDGEENWSGYVKWAEKWADHAKVKKMVKKRQKRDDWHFTFMGANIDSYAIGHMIGVRRGSTITYDHTGAGAMGASKFAVRSASMHLYTDASASEIDEELEKEKEKEDTIK